jgi:hypothetical protein
MQIKLHYNIFWQQNYAPLVLHFMLEITHEDIYHSSIYTAYVKYGQVGFILAGI